jgi:signal transduction histidine kinase
VKIRFAKSSPLAARTAHWCTVALLSLCAIVVSVHAQDVTSIAELNRMLTTPPAFAEKTVTIRGVVNHAVPRRNVFYVQEDTSGVLVKTTENTHVPTLGAEVEIKARASYLGETIDTMVTAETVRVLGQPGVPSPLRCTLSEVVAGKRNRCSVEVEAVVISATPKDDAWQLFMADGTAAAAAWIVTIPPGWKGDSLVGNRVRFRGIVGGAGFAALRCSTPEEISVLGPASLAEAGVVTSAHDLLGKGLNGAKKGVPFKARGVCTYPNSKRIHFYLHDGTGGIVVNLSDPAMCPAFGEEVEVTGVSSGYQEVIGVNAISVKKLGAGQLPEPTRASPADSGFVTYSQWLEIEGVVIQGRGHSNGGVQLHVAGDNSWCTIAISKPGGIPPDAWAGARMRFRGINAGVPRISLFCADRSLVTVLQPGWKDPFDAPTTTVEALVAARKPTADRVKVSGTVLDVKDGWIYLREGQAALRADLIGNFPSDAGWSIPLTTEVPAVLPQPGQAVEIVGSPMVAGDYVALRCSHVRVLRPGEAPEPRAANLADAVRGKVANNLVTVRGRLRDYFSGDYASSIAQSRWREVLRIDHDGSELEVVYENANNRGAFSGFKVNDLIEATGILRPEDGTPPYRLRVRTLADLRSLGVAPEVVRARQFRIFAGVAAVMLTAGAWIVLLRNKLKRERLLAAERMRADAAMRELNTSLESRVGQRTAELQKTQEELQRALATEREVGELKSRFVSLVSHEFRTPLGITMSAVELLRGYIDRLSKEKREELLDDIHQSTLRMSGMMEQVLLLGRVEAGKLPFQAVPIDLLEFGGKFVDEMHSATDRKCEVEFHAKGDLAGARGDESLMRHVLANLISNAVKYSPAGTPVDFQVRREGDHAVFTIRDHGIGIPAADQIRLFEAFHRAKNVGETPGTGLGLLIVKRCVELHHGTILFESRETEGTTFTVRLPLFADVPAA